MVSRGDPPGLPRESAERIAAVPDRSQTPGQQQLAMRSTRRTRENIARSTVSGVAGRAGIGDAADQLSSLQICPQSILDSQAPAQPVRPRKATHSELQVRATTAEGTSQGSRALLRRANSSWTESVDKPSTADGSKPVVRVGKTIVPSFHGRYPPQPATSAGFQSAGEGHTHTLTVHGNDINSSVHSVCASAPISSRPRTPDIRMMGRSSVFAQGDNKGAIQAALASTQHSMHRPTRAISPKCTAPVTPVRRGDDRGSGPACAPSKAESRWTHKMSSDDQSKMAPLQFNSQGAVPDASRGYPL